MVALVALLLLVSQAHAGNFTYTFGGWVPNPFGALWAVEYHGTDANDAAYVEGQIEQKDDSGNWNYVAYCWSTYHTFMDGSTSDGVYQGWNNHANVGHFRLVLRNHFGANEVVMIGYFDLAGNTVFPVDPNGNPTDPHGNPLPPFAASMKSERTGKTTGVIHVTGITMGDSADGSAHTDINVMLSGDQAALGTVSVATPLPARDTQHGTWDIPVNINDATNPAVAFNVILTPMVQSSADTKQAKTLPVSWPAYTNPPPTTAPATQPTSPDDESTTRPAGNSSNDMAGNPLQGVGYGFGQGGLNNPYAPPPYPVPASTQPNGGTAVNGVSTTMPSDNPSNYRPQGPGPGTGSPLTGGGGVIGGKVIDGGPDTQSGSSPSETGVNYGEYGTGGPWDRIRQKIIAWLQLPPSMPTTETSKITIPIPWFDSVQNFDIDFDGPYMNGFRVAIRAFVAIFVVIAFLHQVIKDIRAY